MSQNSEKSQGNTRRSFLRTAAATGAAAAFVPKFDILAQEAKGANERIGVGFIGTGGRAGSHMGIVKSFQQQGITQPGTTIVCGDSHTATHGAFGAIAFGIGTTQVRDVLATQTIAMEKLNVRRINVEGELRPGGLLQGCGTLYYQIVRCQRRHRLRLRIRW